MSSLKVRQIEGRLRELFAPHLNLSDIANHDKEKDGKVLSRCLAAFAIYEATGCSPKEAALSVWDGSDDNGIDAAFFDTAESRVLLVQAKWISGGSGEPSAKDILAFAKGVKDVVELEQANFAPRLHARLSDVSQALQSPGTTIEAIVISTGSSTIARHGTAHLDQCLSDLNGVDQEPIARKRVMGLKEVYDGLASDKTKDGITLDANILDWSAIAEPQSAYFGIIDGLQLKEWWTTHGKHLITHNIRHALGSTDVNNNIEQTVLHNPEYFWYYNNGITLIAEESEKAPVKVASRASGHFRFKRASIVNGAQTVSTLGRIDKDECLGRVRVPIRVIIVGAAPDNFGAEVTKTNNLQNRVEGRDFVAQDPHQVRIQSEMGMEGIEYQYLRGDDLKPSANSCELIEVTTALACATGDPAMAVAVKTGIGRFFFDLTKPPYKVLFNSKLSGAKAFNTTLIQREVDAWIEEKKRSMQKKSGFAWGLLIHGNRLLSCAVFKLMPSSITSQTINAFRASKAEIGIPSMCGNVYHSMLERLNENYQNKFLAVLFKNPSMCRDVFKYATAQESISVAEDSANT